MGLGGRLDATNVIADPAVSVITPVDMDHEQYLGDTLAKSLVEKAGILKAGDLACIGVQHDEAQAAIESRGHKVGARTVSSPTRISSVSSSMAAWCFRTTTDCSTLTCHALPGRFQIENAGLAIAAVRALDDERISADHIAAGMAQPKWSARMERLEPGYLHTLVPEGTEIWLDGGHNPSAGRAVAAALAELDERSPRPLILVTGMLNTKRADGYLKPVCRAGAKGDGHCHPG